MNHEFLAGQDRELIQIVDRAMAETARKSGEWLLCRPGCTQCCTGTFPIDALDVFRLRRGMDELAAGDPARAARVRERALESVARIGAEFPGDAETGWLNSSEEGRERFDEFANDEPCPALDPETGLCDLYDYRPMTCRRFGPPMKVGAEEICVCELCYQGATDEQIAACAVECDPEGRETELLAKFEAEGDTIVAYCLAR